MKTRLIAACLLLGSTALLSACGKPDKAEVLQASLPAKAATISSAAAPMPDVGKVEVVKAQAHGMGGSASEAVADAMKIAILQVNGATIETASIRVKFGMDVSTQDESAWLRGQAFAEAVSQRSGGVIQNLVVLELKEPSEKGQPYRANIEVGISKFAGPSDLGKVKVVIAPPKFNSATITIGDSSVSADELAATLRQRVSDGLGSTGRFVVLDREANAALDQELDQISKGKAPSSERAKLSQAVSADIVWTAQVTKLGYLRHARQLRSSDRQLVSYSGGWAMSHKLVNVATRQVMMSSSLHGDMAPTQPTTIATSLDSNAILEQMTVDMVAQAIASILQRTFPITVVSREGTGVILSQGGEALRVGAKYALVAMGPEIRDPQTGQSLGRSESPIGKVVIDRVTATLSYGHIEDIRGMLESIPIAGLQLRRELDSAPATPGQVADATPPSNSVVLDGGPAKASAILTKSTRSGPQSAATSTSVPPSGTDGEKW